MQVSSNQQKKRVLIIAGEASGDNYGCLSIRAMKELSPDQEVWAVGGEKMEEAGARLISHYSKISVVGLVEVAGKLPSILRLLNQIKELIRRGEVHCIVLIDFPDFNFIVGKYAKRFNIPVIYYIPPQMWAWRERRVKALKKISKEIIVPFPFEVNFYKNHGVDVKYFGHPLLETLRKEDIPIARNEVSLPGRGDRKRIGLFPGSRDAEILRLLPLQLEAGDLLKKKNRDIEFYLFIASSSLRGIIEGIVKKYQYDVHVLTKEDCFIAEKIDLAIASSGTVTLELAIMGVPTVIIYKVSPLTYIIGKMLVTVDRIGLPNIVTGEEMFPELVQYCATPENIAAEIERLSTDISALEMIKVKSHELIRSLGGDGPSTGVAKLVLEEMEC